MIPQSTLQRYIVDGLLSEQRHPCADHIRIYNYTPQVQYDKAWDDVTRQCRGLILDIARDEVLARPFPKFFNHEEHVAQGLPLPAELPIVTEKYDGCFRFDTPLQCWDGSTVLIGDVVSKKLRPILIGMDEYGNLVPSEIIDHFNNGTKDNWLAIAVSCHVSKRSGMGRYGNTVRITSNHHILLNGKYQPASMATPGDEIITFEPSIPPSIAHCIEAGLLGDGSLSPTHNGYRYTEGHKAAHKDYIDCINSWFGNCALKIRPVISGYGTEMLVAGVRQYPELTELRKKWYPQDVKKIPGDLSWIDHFAVAKWYMDDGCLAHTPGQKDRANFATNGFLADEVYRLASRLQELYGVKCTVYNSKGWALRINAGRDNAIARFWQAIAPHIVPCMRYKLPEEYRSVPYIAYPVGYQGYKPSPAMVLSVSHIPVTKRHFPHGRTGFDIKTTTGNYFAKGVLVHNSLGILYWLGDEPWIATRGRFTSPHAQWATAWLRSTMAFMTAEAWDMLRDSSVTHLFEIIAPVSALVVHYDFEGLVHLATLDKATGKDHWPLPLLPYMRYPRILPLGDMDLAEIQRRNLANEEGYVALFPESGLRLKAKFAWYVERHRIITGLSAHALWECWRDGQTLQDVLTTVPDEMYDWIRQQYERFTGVITWNDGIVQAKYQDIMHNRLSRSWGKNKTARDKEIALKFQEHPDEQAYLFQHHKYREMLWKSVEPSGSELFRTVNEDTN